jgi:glycosyltransferase involved in cell wall biosynthesis
VKVLFLNQTGEMSGAERALLDFLEGRPAGVEAVMACPSAGPLAGRVREVGVPVTVVPEVRLSFRLHPWRTGRGLAELTHSAVEFVRLARRQGVDLVHANSSRAGLVAALAASLGAPPVLVHLHDCLPQSSAGRLTRRLIGAAAEVVVVNSTYTADSFGGSGSKARIRMVHNAVDAERFKPDGISRRQARSRLGLGAGGPVLGMVAQLTPWKGQDDAIKILAGLRRRRPEAQLLLVGSAQFTAGFARLDNVAFERSLRAAVAQLGLEGAVHFLGHRSDMPEILRALDLLILPSLEEPFGICLLEAMSMRVPVVATSVGGPTEIVTDGVDGFLLPPRQPELWAGRIDGLLGRPEVLSAVGRKARLRAQSRFTRSLYVEGMLAAYSDALGRQEAVA